MHFMILYFQSSFTKWISIYGIELMEVDELEVEGSSLCESESSSIANLNYTGPDDLGPSSKVTSRSNNAEQHRKRSMVILTLNTTYMKSFSGVLQLFEVVNLYCYRSFQLSLDKSRQSKNYFVKVGIFHVWESYRPRIYSNLYFEEINVCVLL